ncbi:hypothetical protein [Alkaliphilus transvaalensis]|uniref:hypothetical protein n=1 Tax=Alkaliphilus transvaalensis TaxID=114628 RepID=UPI000556CA67|nr:hypothetical protein [Alkaliphilus transvaalensis]
MNPLFYNWLTGFIIPWIAGIYLAKKNPLILLVVAPLGSAIAHIFNRLGLSLGFWRVQPFEYSAFSTLPMDIGVYSILASFLVYVIIENQEKTHYFIFSFSLITTIMEYAWLVLNFVVYDNYWNIFHTFLSYLLAYYLVYGYYLLLKKYEVFSKTVR